MNAPGPNTEQAKPAQTGRDLNSAIVACFSPDTETPPFPNRLVELTVALTSQRNVSLWAIRDPEEPVEAIASHKGAEAGREVQKLAADFLAERSDAEATHIQIADGYLLASVALQRGSVGVLLVEMPASGAVARALAYERLTLLANLSFAQFRHGDMTGQSTLIHALAAVAGGDLSQMQALTDTLAQLTGADYAAAGLSGGQAFAM